ncbi:MAG: hypothetical protein ACRD16_17140 [Thermoanaerobaculia bacterium]
MKRRALIAMASTASGGAALLAIAWLATRRLSPTELGFFFSFLSFGALVQLADFGLTYASLQMGSLLSGTGRLSELASVAARVRRWNLAASGLATAMAGAIGSAIFSSNRSVIQSAGVTWHGPWAAFLVSVFLNQLTVPQMALREGSGRVTQMWRLRLVQEWIAGAACLSALHAGWGLWSLPAFAGVRGATAAAWLAFGDEPLAGKGVSAYPLGRWMTEIWPFQWKIGVSTLSGFLIFRAFSPIVLLEKGPVAAGSFGLAISLMNLLISISTAWPMSHAARFSTLLAAGQNRKLRREFPRMLWGSTALSTAGTAALTFILWKAQDAGITFALRLPDPVTTALILLGASIHHVVACFAVVLRSEGREPLLAASVAGGVVTVSAVWLASHFGSLRDVALANLACTALGLPVVIYLFLGRRHLWVGPRERMIDPIR